MKKSMATLLKELDSHLEEIKGISEQLKLANRETISHFQRGKITPCSARKVGKERVVVNN